MRYNWAFYKGLVNKARKSTTLNALQRAVIFGSAIAYDNTYECEHRFGGAFAPGKPSITGMN